MRTIEWNLVLLFMLTFSTICSPVFSDLILSKVERRIDLTSQIVRSLTTLKVENSGDDSVTEVLLPFPDYQAKHLAFLLVVSVEEKGKSKDISSALPVKAVTLDGMPPAITCYSVSLPKELGKGERLTLLIKVAFTHALKPFPEKITQSDIQLLVFQDSAHYLSPYTVKAQSLSIKLPEPKVESYTRLENTKLTGSDIKYGPYENLSPFSYSPVVVHFVSNAPFPVAEEMVREVEISHWGNVQITEYYNIINAGAKSTGEFSRLDYQGKPHLRGASSFRHLVARLPPRAHSVYYRDEIGNISTSALWSDSTKTILEIEPRYPMFGGWRTSFTIGYGLPLKDFLFEAEGKRFLNMSFGSPVNELVIEKLIVKVILPEGSKDISVSVPFPVKESQELKFSNLDLVGRPVVVLEKINVVPEHSQYFQVSYRFNSISLLREPLMLVSGFFLFFIACIIYTHADLTISKSSASYIAKLQWDEVLAAIQQFQDVMNRCLAIHDTVEQSLRDLSRTGDVQSCKTARKVAVSSLKEISKELKPLLTTLQSSPQAALILFKVEEVVAKEKELQEKLLLKHSAVVDAFEKKVGGNDIENRVASVQQKIIALRQEVDDLLEVINEI